MSPRSNCISLAKKLFNMPHPTDARAYIAQYPPTLLGRWIFYYTLQGIALLQR